MTTQDQRNELCEDLAELFGALPKTDKPRTKRLKLARELILGLIGDMLDRLQELGLEWR